jgi:hypothetical protein
MGAYDCLKQWNVREIGGVVDYLLEGERSEGQ